MTQARTPREPLTFKDLPLDRPIPIADIARAMNMRTERARRLLLRAHRKHDEPVLLRIGERWMVASINRLRQVWHGTGERGLTVEELTEQLEESREREERALDRARDAEKQIQSLRARQRATETRMVELERSFERGTQVIERLTATQLERPTPSFEDEK